MESMTVSHVADASLLKRLTLDLTAILIGYNIPREVARQLAAQTVERVREHFAVGGSILRIARL